MSGHDGLPPASGHDDRTGAHPTRFDRALDELGTAIVRGDLPAGHADTVEGLVGRTGASRSVVRESTRVLTALGMLSAGRRVGLRVRGREHWDVLDPLVIRWRLAGPERTTQIAELRALRRAVEPEAAAAAARRVAAGEATGVSLRALEGAAAQMRQWAGVGAVPGVDGPDSFLAVDSALHAAVLALCDNAMFARLRTVIEESLRERALVERADLPPDPHDVDLHLQVARAIREGSAEDAARAMREIVVRTR
ncbi:FCD domain-containing protein [Brachybacterium halotolerans subsp. kimchii]|uniref:FadR/GntR family transcriptional regulator n=1 Tax=Brachybacterium halotolerans TaxID=2795215 RepID=UPI001E61EBF5|nr:FCD domain-containing protein [Brachybacterium halotolerans]UEJ81211.1 FCD domain-containing protein [Brachybacterium halotolerans subsp. kimchii]